MPVDTGHADGAEPHLLGEYCPDPRRWADLLVPCCLLAAALVALSIDIPFSQWACRGGCPDAIWELADAAEPFGNGLGVLLIGLAVFVLDRPGRARVPRVIAAGLAAGILADLVKLTVARTRPCAYDFAAGVWGTFRGALPLVSAGSAGQSFPSAHTATAVGLAAALAWAYPRGRTFFAALAVLVACQRVIGGAHYPSDALCGVAVGWVTATYLLRRGRLAAWFDRWETARTAPATIPFESANSTHRLAAHSSPCQPEKRAA